MTSFLKFAKKAVEDQWAGNNVKAMLVQSGWTPNIAADTFYTAQPFEPVGNGTTVILGTYPTGGVNQYVSATIVGTELRFTSDNFTLTGATIPGVVGVVWYVVETSHILAADMFGAAVNISGTWTYTHPADGFLVYVGDPG